MDYFSTASGAEFMSQSKMVYSDHVSIQGTWHPHVHSEPRVATAQFPCPELSQPRDVTPSASDALRDMSSVA